MRTTAAESGGGGSGDAGGSGSGGTGGGSGDGAIDAGGSGDSGSGGGPACMGGHPEVEGDNRFCLEGWCGCGLGMEGFDVCYPMDQAEQCCDIDALECL